MVRQLQKKVFIIFSLLFGIGSFLWINQALADPPSRVARLSYIQKPVTFSPAGEDQWVYATYNRPLVTGDRLWADAGGRAELQLGAATARISSSTSLNILNLNNETAQFQLGQGTMTLHIWRLKPEQVYEIDTPNLAFTVKKAGDYRVDVDTNKNTTMVSVRHGKGIIYVQSGGSGGGSGYTIKSSQSCQYTGTDGSNSQCSELQASDDFDQWGYERDHRVHEAVSARYVSRDMIGYEDLDTYGHWRYVPGYGYVWAPGDVPVDWAPYHYGHWVWICPWGWTWVDDEPWGFAPFHYGRWVYVDGWVWIPGPPRAEPVYAPALVAFISSGSTIAWFPLGPRDVYIPSYSVSQNYFININVNNTTVINNTYVTNVYNNYVTNINNNTNIQNIKIQYQNRGLLKGITAVPMKVFTQAQPVSKAALPVTHGTFSKIITKPISPIAPVAPVSKSIMGIGKVADIKPLPNVLSKPVIVKTTPPPAAVPFAIQQPKLINNPGKPLDTKTLQSLTPITPVTASQHIKVITPTTPVAAPNNKIPSVITQPTKPLIPHPAVIQPVKQPTAPVQINKPTQPTGIPHPPVVHPMFIDSHHLTPQTQMLHPTPMQPNMPQQLHHNQQAPQHPVITTHPAPISPHIPQQPIHSQPYVPPQVHHIPQPIPMQPHVPHQQIQHAPEHAFTPPQIHHMQPAPMQHNVPQQQMPMHPYVPPQIHPAQQQPHMQPFAPPQQRPQMPMHPSAPNQGHKQPPFGMQLKN